MAENSFDIIVIGGGPGGYVAAIRAAQLGMNTALVEREHLGGICLNWGCIPTKALLRSAEIYRNMQHAESYGLSAPGATFDLAKIVARSRGVSAQLQGGVKHLLKKNKVTVIEGTAKLAGGSKVAIEGKPTISAPHIILATGARARILPGFEPDGKFIWTYKEALVPDTMPKRLLVIGSGAIGIEFASFFNALGAQVTVAEAMDRVLPVEDAEISAMAQKSFEKQGMKILAGANIKGLKKNAVDVTVTIEAGGKTHEVTVDRIITAIGIVGNVENVGLEATKAKVERTHVITDEYCRTGEPGLYAIGDIAGAPWLAHKASHEAIICVEKIKGLPDVHPLDMRKIPGCTYCHPQVASVGLSEAKAKEKGYAVKVGRFPFMANGKAIALGETEGMIKTVFDAKTGELLGAHMIGAEVTELIQGYVVAKTLETTEAELMHTVFAHPTLSEMMHESVLDAYGRAVHF
ncbi:dihydrolipoyl dehydrogenase [Paramagnetospirillum magneticum]|uniref:Dihydrolipoyl dehydrogenase n=1 Tax=Paramagnetospirillum magneticum (strain ATCC 700264 / AMB-1) TaxID=342108 RepID=Q2W4V0_PARM1|nr:dihydrolipoyl dehydrogenase [Paramagnetospirillum magneticum]BAE51125.1 Pyruvate/2-oxoglutarate dehydrogenase complex, dihydrolipoamide dehydrogenase (E3) component, and related enzyme [Paramagnetospirillum magneticum AMB-1]